jgi:hypothetical protein
MTVNSLLGIINPIVLIVVTGGDCPEKLLRRPAVIAASLALGHHRSGERTRPRVQFPASRRKTLFGETPNNTRGDAYAPQSYRKPSPQGGVRK